MGSKLSRNLVNTKLLSWSLNLLTWTIQSCINIFDPYTSIWWCFSVIKQNYYHSLCCMRSSYSTIWALQYTIWLISNISKSIQSFYRDFKNDNFLFFYYLTFYFDHIPFLCVGLCIVTLITSTDFVTSLSFSNSQSINLRYQLYTSCTPWYFTCLPFINSHDLIKDKPQHVVVFVLIGLACMSGQWLHSWAIPYIYFVRCIRVPPPIYIYINWGDCCTENKPNATFHLSATVNSVYGLYPIYISRLYHVFLSQGSPTSRETYHIFHVMDLCFCSSCLCVNFTFYVKYIYTSYYHASSCFNIGLHLQILSFTIKWYISIIKLNSSQTCHLFFA